MARVRGPYSAAFPVNFTSNGDTTRDAFKKHMDEITRLYGILTEFDKDIANAEGMTGQLTSHINNANPHPNYKPSVSWSNVTDKPGLDDLGGTLTASKVKGALTGATIASGNVTGLEAFVNGKIPASKGDGITEGNLGEAGYVKFNNGLMIQWGKTAYQYEYLHGTENEATFGKEFASSCYGVIAQVCHNGIDQTLGAMTSVTGITNKGFKYIHEKFHASNSGGSNPWFLRYIAIGR